MPRNLIESIEDLYDEIREQSLKIRQLQNETNDDGPGTPLGRLNVIAKYAIDNELCTGLEAKPAELFLIEEIERLRMDVSDWRGCVKNATDEVEQLNKQYDGLAQAAINDGQDLLLKEAEIEQLKEDNDHLRKILNELVNAVYGKFYDKK